MNRCLDVWFVLKLISIAIMYARKLGKGHLQIFCYLQSKYVKKYYCLILDTNEHNDLRVRTYGNIHLKSA